MRWMQSPVPNRKDEYEIHDVPDRKVEGLRDKGWKEVKPKKQQVSSVPSGKAKSKKTG